MGREVRVVHWVPAVQRLSQVLEILASPDANTHNDDDEDDDDEAYTPANQAVQEGRVLPDALLISQVANV